ncbi:MAG: L-threonylcarbamoyladenylate synthase [Victivallaceae bacterium]|nr:L-threonylcarbamoyladenylate synthase [Victivallaceae bacterium]
MKKYHLRKNSEAAIIASCAAVLECPGTVLLIPTETVYGLVCRWDDRAAIERIYALKKREPAKPLALFTASAAVLSQFGFHLNRTAEQLAAACCPGALTIVVPSPAGDTFGFRIPDHPFVLGLLRRLGYPLASTSANRSGEPDAGNVDTALGMLEGQVDAVVDGGAIPPDNRASTVVLAREDGLQILRPGPISEARLQAALRLGRE